MSGDDLDCQVVRLIESTKAIGISNPEGEAYICTYDTKLGSVTTSLITICARVTRSIV